MGVTYYQFSKRKKEKGKKSKKGHTSIGIDRVHHLLLPDPETGGLIPFAEFTYQHGITEVHKSDGSRIVYHYLNKYLLVDKIEYFDTAGNLHSKVHFYWEEGVRLKKKTLKDGSGNPILSKKMQYDKRNNLIRETLKNYAQKRQEITRSYTYYKENNLLEKEVSPTGVTIQYVYWPGTDLIHKKETIAPNGELIYREITEYDEDHLPSKVIFDDVSSERHIQIFERDPQTGRVQRQISVCTDFELGMDRWTDIHDFTYNGQVLIEKKDSNGDTVAREERLYDRAGNLARRIISIYDQSHPIRTYQTEWRYDKRGLPIQEIEEGKKITLFQYDSSGNIIKKTDPRGVTLRQSFDALDRLVEQQSSDGTVHNTFYYQDKGKVLIATDHVHKRIWKRFYNQFGELISEETPTEAIQTWTYDNAGRCTLRTLPDGSSIVYTYSALHMDQVIRRSELNEVLYRHTYSGFDENGHVSEEQCIHNLGTFYTQHDLLERPQSTTTPWHRASINYGPSGLVTRRENSFFSGKDYQYDSLNQLKREGIKELHFDSLGNPLDKVVNSFNQITQTSDTTLLYDANGNLKEKLNPTQITKYRYDGLNRLIQIENEFEVSFEYDPFSRLYAKIIKAPNQSIKQHYYLFDRGQEIGTYNKDLKLIELKVVGLGLREDVGGAVAVEVGGQIYLPIHDFSGNIIALINSRGSLLETRDIDAFGEILLTQFSLNPWGFGSKRTEEGLVYFVGRFYDPALGRWLTPDPAGGIDSPNLYLYVRNNPLSRLDLFGLTSGPIRIEIKKEIWERKDLDFVPAVATFGEHSMDCFVRASQIEKIQFSPEEIKGETLSIIDHIPELIGNDGSIQIILYFNGIKNKEADHVGGLKSISNNLEKVAP